MNKFWILITCCLASHVYADFGIDFHQSMNASTQYKTEIAQQHPAFILAKNLYDSYLNNLNPQIAFTIPPVIHHIWIGSKLPNVQQDLFCTWITYHKHWHHVLWVDNSANFTLGDIVTDSYEGLETLLLDDSLRGKVIIVDIRSMRLYNQPAYARGGNYGEKSDVLRYEVLYYIGGLYVDTDFECLQCFDIFHTSCQLYSGMNFTTKVFNVFNGLIGSCKHHPVLGNCIQILHDRDPLDAPFGKTPEAIFKRSGPQFFTDCILLALDNPKYRDGVVLFPATYFYPWPNDFLWKDKPHQIKSYLRTESFGVHHWHMSWLNEKKFGRKGRTQNKTLSTSTFHSPLSPKRNRS